MITFSPNSQNLPESPKSARNCQKPPDLAKICRTSQNLPKSQKMTDFSTPDQESRTPARPPENGLPGPKKGPENGLPGPQKMARNGVPRPPLRTPENGSGHPFFRPQTRKSGQDPEIWPKPPDLAKTTTFGPKTLFSALFQPRHQFLPKNGSRASLRR